MHTKKESSTAPDPLQDTNEIKQAIKEFRLHRLTKVKRYDEEGGDFDRMFKKARTSFHIIRWMSVVTFGIGVSSIILALVSAYYARYYPNDVVRDSLLTVVFAGMSVTSFVVYFIVAPATRIQIAVSNLLQAEIASVNYLNQMSIWLEALTSPNSEERKCASEQLRVITTETMENLEKYLERDVEKLSDSKQEGQPKDDVSK